MIEVDAQPNYVRVTVKGKIFQMALNDEIRVDESTSKRSETTGDLLIVMPKLNANYIVVAKKSTAQPIKKDKLKSLGGVVDVKNIVVNGTDEVPPLI